MKLCPQEPGKNVGYPQTLTTNKNNSTVNKRYKEWNFGTVYWLVVCKKKKIVTYISIYRAFIGHTGQLKTCK